MKLIKLVEMCFGDMYTVKNNKGELTPFIVLRSSKYDRAIAKYPTKWSVIHLEKGLIDTFSSTEQLTQFLTFQLKTEQSK